MNEITLTSEIIVRPIQSVGGDHMVVASAKVSTCGEDALAFADPDLADDNAGLINYLMKNRHGTPFEHGSLTFFVHAPMFVWWEWVRHRVGFSYNLESSRYKVLDPVFWIPRPDRKMVPASDHKPARPKFDYASEDQYREVMHGLKVSYRAAYLQYRAMIDDGIASEVARTILPSGVYFSGWVTANPRSIMAFLSLRTHEPEATLVSRPQAEIEEAARAVENMFADGWPLTHASFNKSGRVGP